jgi:hypothetical protein
MKTVNTPSAVSAAWLTASLFGVLCGLGGILHGIGEILQGNVTPRGIIIESWTRGPIAAHMDGDPALTVVPNILATGILATVVSLAVIVWAVWFLRRRKGGLVLLLLSIVLFLVGGGFGPPSLGFLAGVAGTGINAPYRWWRRGLHVKVRKLLAGAWPWVFAVCAANGLFLVVGHVILVFSGLLVNPDVFTTSFSLAVVLLLLSILTGIVYDIRAGEREAATAR